MMATVEVVPQPMVALQQANRTRQAGAAVKALIAEGRMTVAEALVDHRAGHLPVRDVLRAQQGWGYARAASALRIRGIAETRRVRMLTERQREALAMEPETRTSGLSGDMLPVLRAVVESSGPVLAIDLFRRGWRQPSSTLRALERRGFVKRYEDPEATALCWMVTVEGRRRAARP